MSNNAVMFASVTGRNNWKHWNARIVTPLWNSFDKRVKSLELQVKKDVRNVNMARATSEAIAEMKHIKTTLRNAHTHEIGTEFARKYHRLLLDHMSKCTSPHCVQRNAEYVRLLLRVDVCWENLREFRLAKRQGTLGGFILSRLGSNDIPVEKVDRSRHCYKVNNMMCCWYCMLAFYAIPDGSARKYLLVFSFAWSVHKNIFM